MSFISKLAPLVLFSVICAAGSAHAMEFGKIDSIQTTQNGNQLHVEVMASGLCPDTAFIAWHVGVIAKYGAYIMLRPYFNESCSVKGPKTYSLDFDVATELTAIGLDPSVAKLFVQAN